MFGMFLSSLLLVIAVIGLAILPMRCKWQWKLTLAIPVFLAGMKNQLFFLFGGPRFFAPQLPAWIMLSGAILYCTLLFFFLFLLMFGIVRLLVRAGYRFTRRPLPCKWRTFLNVFHLFLLTLAFALSSAGAYFGNAGPVVRKVMIPAPEKLRIVFLTDLHAGVLAGREKMSRIVQMTNELNPDCVLIGGDFVDGTVEQFGKDLEVLKNLHAPLGVWAVPGNHEYFSGYLQWRSFLFGANVKMLENKGVMLTEKIFLAGITDPAAKRYNLPCPDLGKVCSGKRDAAFAILLAHRPGTAREAKRFFDLQLSGHTHGGMTPVLDQFIARFNGGFVSGLYQVENMKLYVSDGTGIWNGFPVRLGHPAEITLIELVPSPAGSIKKLPGVFHPGSR